MSTCTKFVCLVLLAAICAIKFAESHHVTQDKNVTNRSTDFLNNTLAAPVRHKRRIFFIPFAKPHSNAANDAVQSDDNECPKDDEDDFPQLLPEDQIERGGIVLVVFIGIYGFTLLAVVCNEYFLPCVETICERVNLTPDVAAATFMSVATSTPEFFTNIFGTFVTKSDLGIGTIVGSSLCNALLVPAVGGLNSPYPLQLDWYPLTRDTLIYMSSVTVLIVITWDGRIYWYETLIPLGFYVAYFFIMFNNKRIAKFIKKITSQNKVNITLSTGRSSQRDVSTIDKEIVAKYTSGEEKRVSEVEDAPKHSIMSAFGSYMKDPEDPEYEIEHQKVLEAVIEEEKKEAQRSLFRKPEGNWFQKCLFYYTWPTKLITRYTIPNPLVYPRWFPLTFLMCIVWIGINSYIVSWMISIIGNVTKLPDALLGMTLMAVGGCLPETVSMTIIARRGEGSFGVSNSLGANTMNVLYSLGLPWFFKNAIRGFSNSYPVVIQSGSIEYTIMSLIVAAAVLYAILLLNKFRLSKISGCILGIMYISMVALAIVSQTVLFKSAC